MQSTRTREPRVRGHGPVDGGTSPRPPWVPRAKVWRQVERQAPPRRRATWKSWAVPVAGPRASSRDGLELQRGVEVLVLGDDLLEQGPVDGGAGGDLLDVAQFLHRLATVQDELRVVALVDHRGLFRG